VCDSFYNDDLERCDNGKTKTPKLLKKKSSHCGGASPLFFRVVGPLSLVNVITVC
jgi:hypothetical protein